MLTSPATKRFKGLDNTSDPLRLGADWLVTADNVDVVDTGAVEMRAGYSLAQALAGITGAYNTLDYERAYVVAAGVLRAITSTTASTVLATGLSPTRKVSWAEVNEHVFFTNGADSGVILPDNSVLPWAWAVPPAPTLALVSGSLAPGQYQACVTQTLPDGRETGPSDVVRITVAAGQALQISGIAQNTDTRTNVYIAPADSTVFGLAATTAASAIRWNYPAGALGRPLRTFGTDPLPAECSVIQFWGGRMHAAQYSPSDGTTAIWRSKPLGFHLFDLEADVLMVPGRVLMLAPHADALIIGTDLGIHAFDGTKLTDLAPYGVVPGQHWAADDDDSIIFQSTRGACRALPFKNLHEKSVSFAPGLAAGGAIRRSGGQRHYLVAIQQGGSAFNQN